VTIHAQYGSESPDIGLRGGRYEIPEDPWATFAQLSAADIRQERLTVLVVMQVYCLFVDLPLETVVVVRQGRDFEGREPLVG